MRECFSPRNEERYYSSGGARTNRVASFKFDECGGPSFLLNAPAPSTAVCANSASPANAAPITLNATSVNGFVGAVDLTYPNPFAAGISGSFSPTTAVNVGDGPEGLVSGDLNNDGNIDLVATNFNAGSVSVLIGNGSGGFQHAASYYYTGSYAYTSALGDFDSDGFLDIVVANAGSSFASVLINNGDGTFTEKTKEANLMGIVSGLNTLHADYDNDGEGRRASASSDTVMAWV